MIKNAIKDFLLLAGLTAVLMLCIFRVAGAADLSCSGAAITFGAGGQIVRACDATGATADCVDYFLVNAEGQTGPAVYCENPDALPENNGVYRCLAFYETGEVVIGLFSEDDEGNTTALGRAQLECS